MDLADITLTLRLRKDPIEGGGGAGGHKKRS